MIEVKNITKKYGKTLAVDDISFSIKEGEIVGLLGPNGAGKSTTMNMLTGFIEPTEGEITIEGFSMSKKPKQAKKLIGYMPEGVPLYTDLNEIIKNTGLEDVQSKLIKNWSRGYKQRVSMAGCLVGEPKILILDEPTVGLDPKQITEIRNLIKELGKTHTVILSSHILSEVSQICNKVIIINKGKIVAIDTPQNLENKVSHNNSLYITAEDPENKVESIKEKISEIEKIEKIKTLEDGTTKYIITAKGDVDLRKTLFAEFAKENITIYEMKKADTSLEDAFIQLIEGGDK